jgi:hypothetical protein
VSSTAATPSGFTVVAGLRATTCRSVAASRPIVAGVAPRPHGGTRSAAPAPAQESAVVVAAALPAATDQALIEEAMVVNHAQVPDADTRHEYGRMLGHVAAFLAGRGKTFHTARPGDGTPSARS